MLGMWCMALCCLLFSCLFVDRCVSFVVCWSLFDFCLFVCVFVCCVLVVCVLLLVVCLCLLLFACLLVVSRASLLCIDVCV